MFGRAYYYFLIYSFFWGGGGCLLSEFYGMLKITTSGSNSTCTSGRNIVARARPTRSYGGGAANSREKRAAKPRDYFKAAPSHSPRDFAARIHSPLSPRLRTIPPATQASVVALMVDYESDDPGLISGHRDLFIFFFLT